ncbi:MAG: hypothetical protein M1831_004355 [Alyxoria varia]|nr:MAG: hypothetical protein M1831_004355 [Alyxoria varia]
MPWWSFGSSVKQNPDEGLSNTASTMNDRAASTVTEETSSKTIPTSSSVPPPSPSTILEPSTETKNEKLKQQRNLFYKFSIFVCIAAPIVVALPPRRTNLNAYILTFGFFYCAGFITEEHTGQGLLWWVGTQVPSEANRERKRWAIREKDLMVDARESLWGEAWKDLKKKPPESRSNVEEERKSLEQMVKERVEEEREMARKDKLTQKKNEKRGIMKKVWMGGEDDDWIDRRKEKENRALDEGKGYSGLIMDYVKEGLGLQKPEEYEDDEEGEESSRNAGKEEEKKNKEK